jgi:hypothetical protein
MSSRQNSLASDGQASFDLILRTAFRMMLTKG